MIQIDIDPIAILALIFSVLSFIANGILAYYLSRVYGDVAGARLQIEHEQRMAEGAHAEQSKSVRSVLKLGMDQNQLVLKGFWTQIETAPESDEQSEDPNRRKRRLARQFVQTPLPLFDRETLKTQMPLMAIVLQEQEIVQVFQFYERLAKLETLRAEIVALIREQREELEAATRKEQSYSGIHRPLAYVPPQPFDNRAPSLWDQIERVVVEIFEEGNPLG